ncbi:MAG: hypothetical protein IJJ30_05095 [Erysipelotrichaceae bacterium]|nr:hypothetical protein [Erysipelotrichaceae bacterium]
MIRTNVVKLTTIPALAYRQKLDSGDIGLVIVRPDIRQPGIAAFSKKTGDPVPTKNTPAEGYPAEAFMEAARLTARLPYHKQRSIRVTKKMLKEPKAPAPVEEVEVDSFVYQDLIDQYTDKTGKFSYDLFNKDLIRFAHRSSVVRDMIEEKESAKKIADYIFRNKVRNITKNDGLTNAEIDEIHEVLDDLNPKGLLKDLNAEIRKLLSDKR